MLLVYWVWDLHLENHFVVEFNHWLVHSTQLPEQRQSLQNASSTSDNDNEDVGNIENGDENADILFKCAEKSVNSAYERLSLFDKRENF